MKLSTQVQDCTITNTVMQEAGPRGAGGEWRGGEGKGGIGTDAGNSELCKTITRSKRRHANRFATVKSSIGGSIASTDLTTLILHHAVIGGHGVQRFCKAPAANNHSVILQKHVNMIEPSTT